MARSRPEKGLNPRVGGMKTGLKTKKLSSPEQTVDIPSEKDKVDEIKKFMDEHNIPYAARDTKEQLIGRISVSFQR